MSEDVVAHVGRMEYVHQVVLEEILQFPLSGRIGEVSDIKSSTLRSTLDDGLVLRGIDWLVATGANRGAFSGASRFGEGSGCHLGGSTVDGSSGHVDRCI